MLKNTNGLLRNSGARHCERGRLLITPHGPRLMSAAQVLASLAMLLGGNSALAIAVFDATPVSGSTKCLLLLLRVSGVVMY